ncbi:MAG: CHAT domain-containing protein [Pyrinomonadaceae bacterium]
MLDKKYFEELLRQEEELVQEYVDKELTSAEQQDFKKKFLISDERREKVKFALALRKYVDQQETSLKVEPKIKERKNFQSIFKSLFASPLAAATGFLVIVFASFSIWYFYLRSSVAEQEMASLNRTYQLERPLKSRITDFVYAPFKDVRGETESKIDINELNLAENTLIDESKKNPNAENFQVLGRLYLAKKEFDEAVKQLEKAGQIAPKNSKILNDLGVAQLELSKNDTQNLDGENLKLQGKALVNFEKAIELNPELPEAYFNKALVLQEMKLTNRAREAWQEYLKLDADSRWAEEARRNLKILETSQIPGKTAGGILQEFLSAYRERDGEKAYQIVSRNREMIESKLIPQQLAFLFVEKEGAEKREYLDALKYVGDLEKKKSGDKYFAEIAQYYALASGENLKVLQKAQELVKSGYQISKDKNKVNKNEAAYEAFSQARELFDKAGNVWEALLCDYWLVYFAYRINKLNESNERLIKLFKICEKENYKWLLAQAAYWFSVNTSTSNEVSKSLDYSELSLKMSLETFDFYNTQKTYSFMADTQIMINQYQKAFANMEKVLAVIDSPEYSLRQKCRDYERIALLFYKMKMYEAAVPFEKEAIELNETEVGETSFEKFSSANLSRIYGALKKYEQAFEFAEKCRKAAEKEGGQKAIAFAYLQLADLELEKGDYQDALSNYNNVIEIYGSMEFQPYRYEAEKGRLLCYLAGNNDEAVQLVLPELLRLFENYRNQILEESNRNSFFNDAQSVYDLAIDYEYRRGNSEQAFNYSESSRSRSLLDWQKNGGQVEFIKGVPQIVFPENTVASPLSLSEIQAQMPVEAQLIQYAVLQDKVLIWLITKENFQTFSFAISIEDLTEKTASFIDAVKNTDQSKQADLARKLYRILFSQVEEQIDSGKDIFLIPDKILFHLPFVALMSDKTGNFLVADYKLSFSLSANAFLISSENARERNQSDEENLLSIGNPTFDRTEFPNFKNLPAAEREAREIAALYPPNPTLLLNKNATKSNLLGKLSEADVVNFAAHYTTNEFSPLFSSFLVAGIGKESRLANYELLAEKKLDKPKLIVLSACQTGIEGYYKGEGMIGAGRTFLALGVPLIVASQWKVDSDATAGLMKNFHFYRRVKKLPTASALRQAQLEMLNTPGFREPFYWAGFIVLGGYAQF